MPNAPGYRPIAISASTDVLRGALGVMQPGVTVCDIDGRIVYANPADAELHGWDLADLMGQDVAVYAADGRRHRLSADDWRGVRRWARDSWNRRKDGSLFPVRLVSDVLRDADGEPIGMVTTCEDVSERRRREDGLRAMAANYHAFFEHSVQGIGRIGPQGRFTLVNPSLVRMLEYGGAAELMAVDLVESVYGAPDQGSLLRSHARTDGRIEPVDLSWRRRDGTPILVRVHGCVLHGPTGRFHGLELFVEDVSERRLLQDQLRHAQKMDTIGRLTGGLAHDFNNLLTVIRANIDYVLGTGGADLAEIRQAAEEVRSAAQRGAAMVRQMLAFSRHESLAPQSVDLCRRCREYREVLRRVLPETIDVQVHAGDGVPAGRVDPRAFEQILLNLATNARDAMPDGGALRLNVARAWIDDEFRTAHGWGEPGEYVAITVSDTGAGMADDVRRRAFEPFFTTKPVGIGTGLGLAMVYGLMKQQRGFVSIYSEPAQGTAVRLWFPSAGASSEREAAPVPSSVAVGGNETVLLVEDDATIRRSALRVLERHGYRVLLAEDGIRALELFAQHGRDVNLVLSDLIMPRMGGRELFDRIRASGSAVPFLFASGYTRTDAEAADRLGVDAPFIQKPWGMNDLLQRVRETLDAARL